MNWVETHLEDGREWLAAGRFTAADIAVGYACLLADNLGLLEGLGPLTRAWWARCTQREAYLRAKGAQAAG
jgi:glutathione S-transferase